MYKIAFNLNKCHSEGNCYNVTIAAVNGAGEGMKKTVKIYTAEEGVFIRF